MKKNMFDPFMQVNLGTSSVKPAREIENNNFTSNAETLFVDKKIEFRTPQVKQGFVVLVTFGFIGTENEIGKDLLKKVILETLSLVDLPEYIILVNDAVKIIDEDIDIANTLKNIKKFGTKIALSRESVEYFNVKSDSFYLKLSSESIARKIVLAKKLLKL